MPFSVPTIIQFDGQSSVVPVHRMRDAAHTNSWKSLMIPANNLIRAGGDIE